VSGALAERDFVEKLEKARFGGVEVLHRQPVSIDDCALYPLFTDDLIGLMRSLIPKTQQEAVAVSVVVRAERRFSTPGP
jgi:arsenite methyltransferase